MNISEISLKEAKFLIIFIFISRIRKEMGFGEMIWRYRRCLRFIIDL